MQGFKCTKEAYLEDVRVCDASFKVTIANTFTKHIIENTYISLKQEPNSYGQTNVIKTVIGYIGIKIRIKSNFQVDKFRYMVIITIILDIIISLTQNFTLDLNLTKISKKKPSSVH